MQLYDGCRRDGVRLHELGFRRAAIERFADRAGLTTRDLVPVGKTEGGMMWPPPKVIASLLTWKGWNGTVIRAGSRFHTALLKRFGGTKLIGGDALILTTRGRKTGRPTSTPLFYAKKDGKILIAASFAGSGVTPGWYLNLVSCPEVEAAVDGRTARYVARTLSPQQAEAAWPKLLAVYPTFERYRKRAKRVIPIVELEPIGT